MNEEWWERPTCLLCDYWWGLLAAVVLVLTGYFTRAYWLPPPEDLCFAGEADIPLNDAIPFNWGDTDILFAFDQSGSMAPMIEGAKANARELIQSVSARFGIQRFGVAGFSDYNDFPYQLYQPLIDNHDTIQTVIDELNLANGGDTPEAYGRMIYEAYADPAIDWNDGARKYLVILGDSYPHDPDAGRDGILGTIDDLTLVDVLADLSRHEIILIYVADTEVISDTSLLNAWQEWTGATDGVTIRCTNW
jgi:hypothetical protein